MLIPSSILTPMLGILSRQPRSQPRTRSPKFLSRFSNSGFECLQRACLLNLHTIQILEKNKHSRTNVAQYARRFSKWNQDGCKTASEKATLEIGETILDHSSRERWSRAKRYSIMYDHLSVFKYLNTSNFNIRYHL